jgi:hypothetical protein
MLSPTIGVVIDNSTIGVVIASFKVSHPHEKKRPSKEPIVEQPRSSWMGILYRASESA